MITKLEYTMQNIFQLSNIENECFKRNAWSIPALRGEFENDFSHFFGYVMDDKIVGYTCVRIMYEEAQVCNIAVLPEYQRQGIGSQLVQKLVDFATESGCQVAELEVNTANVKAVGLYLKNGFVVAGVRPNFYRTSTYPTRDAFTMLKQLNQ